MSFMEPILNSTEKYIFSDDDPSTSFNDRLNNLMLYYLILYCVFSFIFTTVLAFLLRVLYRSRQQATSLHSSTSQNNTKTALCVISVILFFSLFTIIQNVIDIVFDLEPGLFVTNRVGIVVALLALPLYYVNSVANLFIYCIGKAFRENLKSLFFPCKSVCKKTEPETEITELSPDCHTT